MMRGYLRIPVEFRDMPDVRKVVHTMSRTIYINKAARKDAKLIILLTEASQWNIRV